MQGLISNLIRPFRFRYSIFDLGPKFTDQYEREDSNILNDRGFRIQYSYYKNKTKSDVCLIYAHCNSGSRVQGLQFIQPIMNLGWNLCLFDFAGSGLSQGQFVSLGHYQSIDLGGIVSMVLKQGNNRINLWGRSMGAATIILYLSQTKQIDKIISCVLDSPYSSLWKVVQQFGKSKTRIPEFIIQHLIEYIRKTILKEHQFDIKEMQLVKKINKIYIPIMFFTSTNDSFVSAQHATQLYNWAPSKGKILEYIDKQHNSPRQSQTISTGLDFMVKNIEEKEENHKQLRMLSKEKKYFCRKMTGNCFADLLFRSKDKLPSKLQDQTQKSMGNITKLNSCHLKNTKNISNLKLNLKQNRGDRQQMKQHLNSTYNPHKIQKSIIKIVLPSKETIMEKTFNKSQFLNNNHSISCEQKMQTIEQKNVFFSKIKKDKENFLNASNNSKNVEQENLQLTKINHFSNMMTKRFNFGDDQQLSSTNTFNKCEALYPEKKLKTQKITVFLKQHQAESPTKASKVNGIKITTKVKEKDDKRVEKSTNVSPIAHKKSVKIKDRVKTEAARNCVYTDQSDQNQGHVQQKIIKIKPTKLYGEKIQDKKEKAWFCGGSKCCEKTGQLANGRQIVYSNIQSDKYEKRKEKDQNFKFLEVREVKMERVERNLKKQKAPAQKSTDFMYQHFQSIENVTTNSTELNSEVKNNEDEKKKVKFSYRGQQYQTKERQNKINQVHDEAVKESIEQNKRDKFEIKEGLEHKGIIMHSSMPRLKLKCKRPHLNIQQNHSFL